MYSKLNESAIHLFTWYMIVCVCVCVSVRMVMLAGGVLWVTDH